MTGSSLSAGDHLIGAVASLATVVTSRYARAASKPKASAGRVSEPRPAGYLSP